MSTIPRQSPARLDPSQLGTKEYWDKIYLTDLATHTHTPDHIGQVWFDESGAEDRTIAFLENNETLGIDLKSATVLDLGTGNASMLMRLREEGWEGELWGVDYSPTSVQLARRLVGEWANARLTEHGDSDKSDEGDVSTQADPPQASVTARFDKTEMPAHGIHILTHDILASWPPDSAEEAQTPSQFDVVHDKGTFDAISLSHEAPTACPLYRSRIEKLVRPGGLLLITSCNWTEAELDQWMSGGDGNALLQRVGRVGYGQFQFGGQSGSVLAGLCWQRRAS